MKNLCILKSLFSEEKKKNNLRKKIKTQFSIRKYTISLLKLQKKKEKENRNKREERKARGKTQRGGKEKRREKERRKRKYQFLLRARTSWKRNGILPRLSRAGNATVYFIPQSMALGTYSPYLYTLFPFLQASH